MENLYIRKGVKHGEYNNIFLFLFYIFQCILITVMYIYVYVFAIKLLHKIQFFLYIFESFNVAMRNYIHMASLSFHSYYQLTNIQITYHILVCI